MTFPISSADPTSNLDGMLIMMSDVWHMYCLSYLKKKNLYMSCVMRKPTFFICENKGADQLRGFSFAVTAKLIGDFVFATRILQSLYFLNPKFQASSHFLWLCGLVCVGPGRKPERWFSHDAAHVFFI